MSTERIMMSRTGTRDPQTMGRVYFIRCNEYVKIGVTCLPPDDRLKALQIGNPYELSIELLVDGGHDVEGELHDMFSAARVRGEWFRAPPEEVTYMLESNGVTYYEPDQPIEPTPEPSKDRISCSKHGQIRVLGTSETLCTSGQ